jgi:ABC-2 type transport system ATP-binding protein
MATVMTATAADGVSVLLSSHVLTELERVASYLILLSRGRVQLAGKVDDLLASHRVLVGPTAEIDGYAGGPVVHATRAQAEARLLVQATADDPVPPDWTARAASLEELALAYLREPGAGALPGPGHDQDTQTSEVTK